MEFSTPMDVDTGVGGMASLPESLLSSILDCVVERLGHPLQAKPFGWYDFALVSRSWHRAFNRLQNLCVPATCDALLDDRLISQLATFPDLTSLAFSQASVKELNADFFFALEQVVEGSSLRLQHLRFQEKASEDAIEEGVDSEALDALFGAAPGLKSLRLQWISDMEAGEVPQPYEIPESLSTLSCLEVLQVTGARALPCSFGQGLPQLHTLVLRAHYLRHLPESFGCLTTLRVLELDCKHLQALPPSLATFSSLERFRIWSAALRTLESVDFSRLRSLIHVFFCLNQVATVPRSMAGLPRLAYLKLSMGLRDLPPWLPLLPSLTHLELSCDLLEVRDEEITALSGLRKLQIDAVLGRRPPFPAALGGLPNLRCLFLGDRDPHPQVLSLSPPLERCTHVRVLRLDCMSLLKSISDEALSGMPKLRRLQLWTCDSLEELPLSLGGLRGLSEIWIHECPALGELPGSLGLLGSLKSLRVNESGLRELPSGISSLRSLTDLELKDLLSFRGSLEEVGRISSLKVAELCNLPELRHMGESWGALSRLESLEIIKCSALQSMPHSVSLMASLTSLVLSHCPELRQLPRDLGCLSGLRSLRVVSCERLQALPEDMAGLSSLRLLHLHSLLALLAIPESLSGAAALELVSVEDCKGLCSVPRGLLSLRSLSSSSRVRLRELSESLEALEALEICGQEHLTTLPQDFRTMEELRELRELTIRGCLSLQSLPDSLNALRRLQRLRVSWCNSLRSLPDTLGGVVGLTELVLCGCNGLTELPGTLGGLHQLESLSIMHCAALVQLPDSFGSLRGLRALHIQECGSFDELPEELGELTRLQSLALVGLSLLESLPDSVGELSSLRALRIVNCDGLLELPSSMSDLTSLVDLSISSCVGLGPPPAALLQLPKLSAASRELVWGLRRRFI